MCFASMLLSNCAIHTCVDVYFNMIIHAKMLKIECAQHLLSPPTVLEVIISSGHVSAIIRRLENSALSCLCSIVMDGRQNCTYVEEVNQTSQEELGGLIRSKVWAVYIYGQTYPCRSRMSHPTILNVILGPRAVL